MQIGTNIKKYRLEKSMTQRDLAEKLHVTAQAVSRWENNEVEPSVDTIKQMSDLFGCSIDDLFREESDVVENQDDALTDETTQNVEDEKAEETTQDVEKDSEIETTQDVEPKVIERIVEVPQKQVIGLCDRCNKPFYDPSEIKNINETHYIPHGRMSSKETKTIRVCKDCYNKDLAEKRKSSEKERKTKARNFKKRRVLSFTISALILAIFVAVAISMFVSNNTDSGIVFIVIGVSGATFAGCLIFGDNFLTELFFNVSEWGFVKFPGVIFSFDLEGLAFLIVVKIIFFILGMILSVLAFLLALVLCLGLSIIAYPIALYRNIKQIEV